MIDSGTKITKTPKLLQLSNHPSRDTTKTTARNARVLWMITTVLLLRFLQEDKLKGQRSVLPIRASWRSKINLVSTLSTIQHLLLGPIPTGKKMSLAKKSLRFQRQWRKLLETEQLLSKKRPRWSQQFPLFTIGAHRMVSSTHWLLIRCTIHLLNTKCAQKTRRT